MGRCARSNAATRWSDGGPLVHELRVRYGECDPQGIVFNANYLVYFDVAFTELWRETVGPWKLLHDHGIDAVVAEANLDFKAPARDDEILSLHAQVTRLEAPRSPPRSTTCVTPSCS